MPALHSASQRARSASSVSLASRPLSIVGRLALATGFAVAVALPIAHPTAAADTAMVRVLHASYDAPAVDVYVDGSKVLSNVAFKGISAYLPVPAGAHTLAIDAAGTTTTVISTSASVEAGKHYTVAAIDPLASIKFAVFNDDAAPTAGTARLRVVHLSPDAPAVDVAVAGQAPADAPVKSLAFPKASGYLAIPGATYHFQVRAAGTTTVALDLPGVALADGTAYSVFAVGSMKASGAQALSVVVATDGTVAPPTSTDGTVGGSAVPLAGVLALALAALLAVVMATRRLRTAREETRRR